MVVLTVGCKQLTDDIQIFCPEKI